MDLVSLHYRSPSEFLDAVEGLQGEVSLQHRTRANYAVGDQVVLEVRIPRLVVPVLLRAEVVSASGSLMVFRPHSDDRASLDYACQVARGEKKAAKRSHSRFPVRLPVDCRSQDGVRTLATTRDISMGGACVATEWDDSLAEDLPKIGEKVRVVVGPLPDGGRYLVYGKVAWARSGENAGFGVRFVAGTGIGLRMALRRASETGHLGLVA